MAQEVHPFPNPIGFYGIDLPSSIVTEIQSMSTEYLKMLLHDIACQVLELEDCFEHSGFDGAVDKIIDGQLASVNDWLSFMQWVLDGLRHKINN